MPSSLLEVLDTVAIPISAITASAVRSLTVSDEKLAKTIESSMMECTRRIINASNNSQQ